MAAAARHVFALALCALLALASAEYDSKKAMEVALAHKHLMRQVEAMGGLAQQQKGPPEVRGLKGVSRQLLQDMLEMAEAQYRGNMKRRAQRLGDDKLEQLSLGDFESVFLVPTYSCPIEARLGRWGEHGDWVCLSHLGTGKREARALTFGTGCETSFEKDLYETLDIRTTVYDFDLSARSVDEMAGKRYISYRNGGLTGTGKLESKQYRFPSVNWVTLPGALKETGANYADIVKIDCVGCEVDVVRDLASFSNRTHPAVGQMLIQVHDVTEWKLPKIRTLFKIMEDLGFRLFHSEANPYYKMHYEVAFIHEQLVQPRDLVSR